MEIVLNVILGQISKLAGACRKIEQRRVKAFWNTPHRHSLQKLMIFIFYVG